MIFKLYYIFFYLHKLSNVFYLNVELGNVNYGLLHLPAAFVFNFHINMLNC